MEAVMDRPLKLGNPGDLEMGLSLHFSGGTHFVSNLAPGKSQEFQAPAGEHLTAIIFHDDEGSADRASVPGRRRGKIVSH